MLQRDQKNRNPKIGRPAKTNQEEQFKEHYQINKKKFQLQCELMVSIHQTFFNQIPCNPINRRVTVPFMTTLFETNNCLPLYETLLKTNQRYFKNSAIFPEEKLRYTSIIDISYLTKEVKDKHGQHIRTTELILTEFFFLFNERLVNKQFYEYFKGRVQLFRKAMIQGPVNLELTKLDVLVVTLGIELAVREQMIIVDDRE